MTRENKLALVLGFGLMLFVGILVSDHLAARQLTPAATSMVARPDTGVPPLPPPGIEHEIVLMQGDGGREMPLPTGNPAGSSTSGEQPSGAASTNGPGAGALVNRLPNGGDSTPPTAKPDAAQADGARTYAIKSGDTFAAIAQREYGRRALGQALADFNGLNPSKLKVGATIKLPTLATLDPSASNAKPETPATQVAQDSPKFKVYKVQQGDTLFRIAQRELGKGDRWKELQSSNAEVLKNGDDLTPGMQIKIPIMTASAERSTDA
ncbi:MAG: LysM peptidoglycan-binding domain-containing protein [Phycisphaerales bacterium]